MNTVAIILCSPLVVWAAVGGLLFMVYAPKSAPTRTQLVLWLLIGGPVVWILGAVAAWQLREEDGQWIQKNKDIES